MQARSFTKLTVMTPIDFHYYQPADGHGLSHNPLNALIAPRPIGWISSRDAQGRVNLAPYSFFNAFNYDPPNICFSSIAWKGSVRNASETGEFVFIDIVQFKNTSGQKVSGWLVLDEVVAVYVDKLLIKDGVYQTADAYPVMRAGGLNDYVQVTPENVFKIARLAGASNAASHGKG